MPTVTAAVTASADDGTYSTFNTTRGTESWSNGSQFLRFQSVAVPVPRRCVVDSATLTLTGSILAGSTPTVNWYAQKGNSLALTSAADASARPKTAAAATVAYPAGLLGANYTNSVLAPIAEALADSRWTVGGAVTLFGVQQSVTIGLTPMSYYTYDSGVLTSAAQKPILTIVWHPAGDAAPGSPTCTIGVRTGRKNARGGVSGVLSVAVFARTGRKNGRGTSAGITGLTGVRAGRSGRKGAVSGGPSLVRSTGTGRAGRRGGTAGAVGFMGVSPTARPARRGATPTGAPRITGQVTGRKVVTRAAGAGRAVLVGTLSGDNRRQGRVLAAPVVCTGQARGAASWRGAVASAVRLTGVRAGRKSHSAGAPGSVTLGGKVTGRPAHHSSTTGSSRTLAAVRGLTRRTGPVQGHPVLTGSVSGRATRSGTVHGAPGSRNALAGVTYRAGGSTGAALVHGWISDSDARYGVVEGPLGVAGHLFGAARRSGQVHGSPVIAGQRRGLAGRAGRYTRGWLPPTAVTTGQSARTASVGGLAATPAGATLGRPRRAGAAAGVIPPIAARVTGQPRRSGSTTGATLEPVARPLSGLAGRSGEVHGWAPPPGRGAGTLTGQAGRWGVSVCVSGTPSGLAAGTAHKRARTTRFFVEFSTGHLIGRAGRASAFPGVFAVAGTASGRPHKAARLTPVRTLITAALTASRSGASTVRGTVVIGGAVRALRAVGGRVSGTLRLSGNLAAAAHRQGVCAGVLHAATHITRGRHGGQGAAAGSYFTQSRLDTPRDFKGATAGSAVLHGRYTGTRQAPMEVPHTVYRVPAPITVPVVPATVTRTNVVTVTPAQPVFTPRPATPVQAVPATVTAKPIKRGVVTRG